MYVCICNKVTDKQIHQAVEEGVCSMQGLTEELNVASCCGKCKSCARKEMRKAMKRTTVNVGLNVTVPVFAGAPA